jgi:hypothetical protein
MPGDEYHCHGFSRQLFFIQSNKAHAVAILTPHIRRAPSFFWGDLPKYPDTFNSPSIPSVPVTIQEGVFQFGAQPRNTIF